MRCTVDGLTPNRSAMTRMPGAPESPEPHGFVFPAQGLSEADQAASPRSWPSQARRGHVPESWRARTRQIRPSSETSPCLQTSWCRAPVGAGIDRYERLAAWHGPGKFLIKVEGLERPRQNRTNCSALTKM